MDTKGPNSKIRSTPQYAEYQREAFWADNEGKVMPFNTGKLIPFYLMMPIGSSTTPSRPPNPSLSPFSSLPDSQSPPYPPTHLQPS